MLGDGGNLGKVAMEGDPLTDLIELMLGNASDPLRGPLSDPVDLGLGGILGLGGNLDKFERDWLIFELIFMLGLEGTDVLPTLIKGNPGDTRDGDTGAGEGAGDSDGSCIDPNDPMLW